MSNTRKGWPTDWPVRSLEKIASLITSGGTPASGSPRYYLEYGGLPFAKTEDLTRAGTRFIEACELGISEIALKETAAKRYPVGTVLISMYGTIGLTKITAIEMAANQALCALIPPLACDSGYLYHHLEYSRLEWLKYSGQTTQANINGSTVRAHEVPLPDPSEQRKIAQILDTLDTAIHETEAIIAKLKAVKQGLLHDLLTRGIAANGELRPPQAEAPHLYQQSPLGWIPKDWEIKSVTKACSDVVDCPHSTPHYQDQGVLVARTMYIKDGVFLETQASRVSEQQYHERIARLKPEAGDVIFTREAPVGEAFIIPLGMKICLGQRVMLLRPKNGRLVAEYLLAQIYSGAVKDRIATLTSGTTNPHLNVSEVKDFEIPLPPFVEQQAIAERLKEHESRLQSEISKQKKLSLLKTGLMDDLLTGRVRVTPLLEAAAP